MSTNCTPPADYTPELIRVFADQWHPTLSREPAAKPLCAGCPMRDACLNDALENPDPVTGAWPTGIFGGTTTEERAKIRRNRADRARYAKKAEAVA